MMSSEMQFSVQLNHRVHGWHIAVTGTQFLLTPDKRDGLIEAQGVGN